MSPSAPVPSMNGLFKPHLTFDKYLLMQASSRALCWVLETRRKMTGPESQVTWVRHPSSHPTCCVVMGRNFISLTPSYCKITSPRPLPVAVGETGSNGSIKQCVATWQPPAELWNSFRVGSLPSIRHIPPHIPKQAPVNTSMK